MQKIVCSCTFGL